MFLTRASAVATRSNRPPRAFSFAPRRRLPSRPRSARPGRPSTAASPPPHQHGRPAALHRGHPPPTVFRPTHAVPGLLLYRTTGARPANTGDPPLPFSIGPYRAGCHCSRRPYTRAPTHVPWLTQRTRLAPRQPPLKTSPGITRHGLFHRETHTRDTRPVVHMGHGRHESPEQGNVGQHVDGDRGEPLLRLALT